MSRWKLFRVLILHTPSASFCDPFALSLVDKLLRIVACRNDRHPFPMSDSLKVLKPCMSLSIFNSSLQNDHVD
jgi:hypothetical protein